MSRNRNWRTVELEFTIHSDSSDDSDESDMTCYICANKFCESGACSRTSTSLKCCTQPICCACVAKTAKRCGCADDCEQIVAHCPFCRDISPLTAKDVFLGLKAPACKACLRTDAVAAGTGLGTSLPIPVPIAQPSREARGSTQETQEPLSQSA